MASPRSFAPVMYDDCEQRAENQWLMVQLPTTSCSDGTSSFGSAFSQQSFSSAHSFSSGILSIDASQANLGGSRRGSLVSPGISISDSSSYTPTTRLQSPMTPIDSRVGFWSASYGYPSTQTNVSAFTGCQTSQNANFAGQQPFLSNFEEFWTSKNIQAYSPDVWPQDVASVSPRSGFPPSCGSSFFTGAICNPMMSRTFGLHEGYNLTRGNVKSFPAGMTMNSVMTEVDTIAPQATFNTLPSTSPDVIVEHQTPTRCRRNHESTLDSSPLALLTPISLSGFTDGSDEMTIAVETEWHDPNSISPKLKLGSTKQPRLLRSVRRSRRGAHRNDRGTVGLNTNPKLVLNNCDIDAKGNFPCSFPHCLENNKQKSFKRAEHRKRHEKTVHGIDKPFACQFCGTSFNRNDNLKQHYKTHGKKSNTQRNEWVAVLDKTSIYYDPHFEGAITRDGYPIRHDTVILTCSSNTCIDVFFTAEALQAHETKKEHRQVGAGRVPKRAMKRNSISA